MSKVQKNKVGQWFLSLGLLFGIILLISVKLWIHFQVDLLMKDIRELEVQKRQLLSERERVRAEVKRLKNIDRIGQIAEQKLGLINDPEPVRKLRMEKFGELDHLKKEFAARKERRERTYSLAGIK